MTPPEICRPVTPPHQPTYGVHMRHETIECVIQDQFPNSSVVSINQLPTGQSYNNRIYFIKICQSKSNDTQVASSNANGATLCDEIELVMKVNGRFFGANKIENEVACLQVLATYCPDVPVPKVYAWSGNGRDITFVSPETQMQNTKVFDFLPQQGSKTLGHGGWMLLSRLPGDPISNRDLDEATMANLTKQMANIVTAWRFNIPLQRYCGNLRLLQKKDIDSQADMCLKQTNTSNVVKIKIRGVLMNGLESDSPIANLTDYYKLRLEKKLSDLETKDVFAPSRASLAPFVRNFIDNTLPTLRLDEDLKKSHSLDDHKFTFTHYDLSPRNVLITGQPPRISGIVDFEFSGFFSPIEEFLNDAVGNDGDWPKAAYDTYLERLEENGIATPGTSVDRFFWDKSKALEEFETNVAPWWLDV